MLVRSKGEISREILKLVCDLPCLEDETQTWGHKVDNRQPVASGRFWRNSSWCHRAWYNSGNYGSHGSKAVLGNTCPLAITVFAWRCMILRLFSILFHQHKDMNTDKTESWLCRRPWTNCDLFTAWGNITLVSRTDYPFWKEYEQWINQKGYVVWALLRCFPSFQAKYAFSNLVVWNMHLVIQ